MKRLRLWILGAAVGSFAAGMNVGLIAPDLFAAAPVPDQDETYMRSMAVDYELTAAQQKSVRLVMLHWRQQERQIFDSVDPAQLPDAARGRILQERGLLEQRIRAVLDEDQRERYDRASRHK